MQIYSYRGLSYLKLKKKNKKIIKLFSLAKKYPVFFQEEGDHLQWLKHNQHFDSILKCLRVSLLRKQLKWNFSFSP